MAYWLVKTEVGSYSIDDLLSDKRTSWQGVRNYQARNYLRKMAVGDKVFIYHSVQEPVGIAGIAEVVKIASPDATQFDKNSEYYDPKADKANPRWFAPDLHIVKRFDNVLPLKVLRQEKAVSNMVLLQRGSRLSVQPVSKSEYSSILKLLK